MADLEDARRIALTLPGATEEGGFGVYVKGKHKGFAWTWNERLEPKKPKVPNPGVLAICTADQDEKAMLIAANPDVYFTEPHYNGFPAVLVRLANIDLAELEEVLTDGWRCLAPKELVTEFDETRLPSKESSLSQ